MRVPGVLRRGEVFFVLTRIARVYLKARSFLPHGAGVEALDAVMVINRADRPERLARFTAEAQRLRLEVDRFDAITHEIGILGCNLSHAELLRRMLERDWNAMMICEDDAEFYVSRRELDTLVSAFLADDDAEVACLAFWLFGDPQPRSLLYLRAREIQTTSCYLVKRSIAADLLELFEEGAEGLANGGDRFVYSLDHMWKRIQPDRVFLVPTVRAAAQIEGWSDVEGRVVNHGV